jgi:arylsulfatase A-like enzyme
MVAIVTMLVTGCGGGEKPVRHRAEGPFNVVLIVSDAMRQDALGCYGGEAATPNLDRVARGGVLFENAYSTSPWTPPSAVSIFTGNFATSYPCSALSRTIQIMVPDDETLLAEALQGRGYITALKNENVQASLHNCFQGFDVLHHAGFDSEVPADTRESVLRIAGVQPWLDISFRHFHQFIAHLFGVPEGRNFFFAHWILDPHEPYRPPARFLERVTVDKSKLTQPASRYTAKKNLKFELNDEETRYLKARYLAEIESVDERVGYIFKILEHRNLLESTFFVFTSDHGELFGEHGRFGHGRNYYEELLRVPLIITGPGLPAGLRVETPVSLVDLAATLEELLEVEYDNDMQGASFVDVIADERRESLPLYFDDVREHESTDALRDDHFKLVALKDSTYLLYDLASDPSELHDAAASSSETFRNMLHKLFARREAIRRRLKANLARLDRTDAPLSTSEREELEKKLKSLGYIQ